MEIEKRKKRKKEGRSDKMDEKKEKETKGMIKQKKSLIFSSTHQHADQEVLKVSEVVCEDFSFEVF